MLLLKTKHSFDSAHYLPDPYVGKCRRMHGHTYHLEIVWKPICHLDDVGMSVDFSSIKKVVEDYLTEYDHHVLNETCPTPTAEVLVQQIAEELGNFIDNSDLLLRIQGITLWETESCAAVWERD